MPENQLKSSLTAIEAALADYKLDHLALVSILDGLKKNPTDNMKTWMAGQTEYKTWNCAALAAYCGLSEATLKKLKSGEIADPRGSTFARFYLFFGILPKDIVPCLPRKICSIECVNKAKLQLDAAEKRIAELENESEETQQECDRLRKIVLAKGEACSAAESRANALQAQIDSHGESNQHRNKHESDLRADFEKVRSTLYAERKEAKKQRIALITICAVAILALALAVYLIWDATHLNAGFFRQ